MRGITALLILLLGATAQAQQVAQPTQGLQSIPTTLHALTNARIMLAPGREIENGTILLSEGLIQSVASELEIPEGYKVWDLRGKTVYPGFIDAYVQIGPKEKSEEPAPPVKGSVSWNPNIRSHQDLATTLSLDGDRAEAMRELGFTTIQTVPNQGVFRGQSAVVQLSKQGHQLSLLDANSHIVAFEYGAYGGNVYPGSLMGSIALIRQTLYDAQWYARTKTADDSSQRPEINLSLAALEQASNGNQRMVFETHDELDFARVFAIGAEFDLDLTVMGNGFEYRSLSDLQEYGKTVIVPVSFPKLPPVSNAEKALDVSLATLQHWELAPSNLAFLADGDVPFAVTTHGLKSPKKAFWKNMHESVKRGLAPSEALASLTTVPAKVLNLQSKLGTIEAGKIANLVISEKDLFTNEKSKVLTVWIDGKPHHTDHYNAVDPRGNWRLTWQGIQGPATIQISGSTKKLKASADSNNVQAKLDKDQLLLIFEENTRSVAYMNGDNLDGVGTAANGAVFTFSGVREADHTEKKDDQEDDATPVPLVWQQFPAGAYGLTEEIETASSVLFKNATVWTSGPKGKIENADLLIRRGRVSAVGQDLTAPRDTNIVDATGKHITPGIVDAHSHSGVSQSVNEATHAVTVEVRIEDVINPTDIALYRELAGGVTTINQLHGSANPMGGQNQVIKLRWGKNANALKFKDAPPGVKFALGENVKQSNWGDSFVTRYPQTRMGVEQIMRDTFLGAREYEKDWQAFRSKKTRLQPRIDLRLQAALEILNGERWVHIHSYRQDEVLMFVRLSQEFGLKVGTFQHILEGYKVAEEMREIGAGASTFSDWWAYKMEVYDAIPYNGALMHRAGVLTSFNSDSNELARRLNTEAAKAVKYGGVSEEDALAFVTINPAIQLGIDSRVGSLEPGKDADFVVWSDHPLSTLARAEQTWVDGAKYFDLETDQLLRQRIASERQRLITKILKKDFQSSDNGNDARTESDNPRRYTLYHSGHDVDAAH
ncbi:MAG: amidohydrolase family protein [Pseudomonadota bacterium]